MSARNAAATPASAPAEAPAANPEPVQSAVAGSVKDIVGSAGKFLRALHPLLEIGEWLGILAGVTAYLRQTGIRRGGNGITVDPQGFRSGAPHWAMQSQKGSISATFALIMQSFSDETSPADDVSSAHCKTLTEIWLPSLGENQQADFAMKIVEMTCGMPIWEIKSGHKPAVVSPLVIGFLKRLAEVSSGDVVIDNQRRTQIADSLNLMRGSEEDYPAVKAMSWIREHHDELVAHLQNRLTERRSSFFGRLADMLIA